MGALAFASRPAQKFPIEPAQGIAYLRRSLRGPRQHGGVAAVGWWWARDLR